MCEKRGFDYDVRNTWQHSLLKKFPDIYKLSNQLQSKLMEAGVAWHNPIGGECTLDFGCCLQGLGEYSTRLKDPERSEKLVRQMYEYVDDDALPDSLLEEIRDYLELD